jgi:hypothetical protein
MTFALQWFLIMLYCTHEQITRIFREQTKEREGAFLPILQKRFLQEAETNK